MKYSIKHFLILCLLSMSPLCISASDEEDMDSPRRDPEVEQKFKEFRLELLKEEFRSAYWSEENFKIEILISELDCFGEDGNETFHDYVNHVDQFGNGIYLLELQVKRLYVDSYKALLLPTQTQHEEEESSNAFVKNHMQIRTLLALSDWEGPLWWIEDVKLLAELISVSLKPEDSHSENATRELEKLLEIYSRIGEEHSNQLLELSILHLVQQHYRSEFHKKHKLADDGFHEASLPTLQAIKSFCSDQKASSDFEFLRKSEESWVKHLIKK